ncbi:MAG: BON domain-containing protein [Acidobacteria bacterium]|nr:BON domain-containing protein [Acidobacteriota bacterium]MBI3424008.1 BON domain-containing protein [Acidobacteriota bacterium]
MKKLIATAFLMMLTFATTLPSLAKSNTPEETDKTLKKIRKELITLPFYSVFDNLAFKYEDGVVTLYGQVARPTLRKDAERVVEKVAGVEDVVNKIEVLPLSSFDDRIRLATYRAIYRQPGLDRLSIQAVPPIHIIVKNGNVTLEGVVNNKGDATRAYLAANGVPNVFSVTNNLRIERN